MFRQNFEICLLFCGLLLVITADNDPCLQSNHAELIDLWRNVDYTSVSNFQCDNQLDRGWYRFIRDNNDDAMPTYPVDRGCCGTRDTVWVNGLTPDIRSSSVMNLTVCVNTPADVCGLNWTIQVKGCATYYVYYLVPTPGCEMAYCVGVGSTTTSLRISQSPTSTTTTIKATSSTGSQPPTVTTTAAASTNSKTTGISAKITAPAISITSAADLKLSTLPNVRDHEIVKDGCCSAWQIAVIITLIMTMITMILVGIFVILPAIRRCNNTLVANCDPPPLYNPQNCGTYESLQVVSKMNGNEKY